MDAASAGASMWIAVGWIYERICGLAVDWSAHRWRKWAGPDAGLLRLLSGASRLLAASVCVGRCDYLLAGACDSVVLSALIVSRR